MANPRLKVLFEKASHLPLSPGVYLMKNAHGEIIYVGKSRKLKNRVSSYFSGEEHNIKTEKMISHVYDFEYILCDGEMEALTLENTLIKKYTPHYNIKLKDAKSYPYIKVTSGEWPKILITRDKVRDGAKYYGPYASHQAAEEILGTLRRIFSLPSCNRVFPRDIGKERPCIYYQMGRCMGPCTGCVEESDYHEKILQAASILSGSIRKTQSTLQEEMLTAAEAEQFERAAKLRDAIQALERLHDKQKVVGTPEDNRDLFALYQGAVCNVIAVLRVRDGKLQYKNEFVFPPQVLSEEEDLTAWVYSFYESQEDFPQEVLLELNLPDEEYELLELCLKDLAGHVVTVRTPIRGDQKKLALMALENAKERAERYERETIKEDATLLLLTKLLKLEVVPDRIESYDISEIGNEHITASMVVTEGTAFKNKDYRTFKIQTLTHPDDYEAMRETLRRRLSHIGDGSPSLGMRPDLILLDGGIGQVHAVQEVLREMGQDIPVFGMIKDDFHKTRALTDGTSEISIALEQSVFVFLYKLQEEVHRVAVRATMQAKTKTLKKSVLENVPGIGPKKAKKILSLMHLQKIKTASQEELVEAGIGVTDADALYKYFHKE